MSGRELRFQACEAPTHPVAVEHRCNDVLEVGSLERFGDEVLRACSDSTHGRLDDKRRVFHEAARLLRAGGRLAIADIVTERPLPEGVVCNADLWAACIGGAAQRDEYRAAIETAGLHVERIENNPEYRFISDRAVGATAKWGVTSVSLLARKS